MNKSASPFISVIICAFSIKRFKETVECINSVLKNNYKDFEIIVVIDGNEELKRKMASEFKGINKILFIGDKIDEGPSIARNRGVGFARGEIVAFIDDDAFGSIDWLGRIVKNFSENPKIMAMGGKLLPVYGNCSVKLPEELLWIVGCTYNGHPNNKQFVRNVISANMAVKKDVFKEINFEVMYPKKKRSLFFPIKQLEDTIFGIRLNKKKQDTVLYDPETIVYHNVPKERLKLNYILKRTFSEGILKAKIGVINDTYFFHGKIFSREQDYLITLLISIVKNFFALRIKDSLLLSLTVLSVTSGYIIGFILNRSRKWVSDGPSIYKR